MPERWLHSLRRRKALDRLRAGPRPRTVVVVCQGNICRSPYAAALLEQELARHSRMTIRVESAGFFRWGQPCPPAAVEVAAAQGVDLSGHRSKVLTPAGASVADLIVVMDAMHEWALRDVLGRNVREVLVLGDLDPEPIDTRRIVDPVGKPKEVFERCYARIRRCVRELADALAESAVRSAARDPALLSQPELTT